MKRKKIGIVLSFLLFLVLGGLFINAEVEYGTKKAIIQENPNVVIKGTMEIDNNNANTLFNSLRFDDNVEHWYVVYQNASEANADGYAHGDIVSVTYKGVVYSGVKVFVGSQFDGVNGLDTIIKDNTTIFFNSGNYYVGNGAGYYAKLYKNNLSIIGLDTTTHSTSVNFDLGYNVVGGINRNPRNLIENNFYAANIVFDAKNRQMKANTANPPYNPASSGEYYIHVAGKSNIAFDNCTIQNLKAPALGGNKNVMLNVIGSDKVVFNNTLFKNTTPSVGHAPLQVNNASSNVYFNNVTLDDVHGNHSGTFKPFIKIENGSTYLDIQNTSVFFTNGLTFTNVQERDKSIYVESYKYNTVAFPSDIYRYAQLRNENGSWTTGYIILEGNLPPTANNYAIFDLKDNAFVVKKGDTFSEEQQIQNIINTISFIRYIKTDSTTKEYNIKYEVGASLDSINLPEIKVSSSFLSKYAGYYENINLNIIPVSKSTNTINEKEIFDFIPNISTINLPENNNRYQIYNIDFDKEANYTLKEVIDGIDGQVSLFDPYTSLYESGTNLNYDEYLNKTLNEAGIVINADVDTFQSCIFTALVQKIQITDGNKNSETVTFFPNDKVKLSALLTNENNNSYTHEKISVSNETNSALPFNIDTSNDNVPLVKWFSDNPSVAKVDQSGNVTILASGSATIVAKAIDEYNDGEIEKPWAEYVINVNDLSIVNVHYVDENNKSLATSVIIKGKPDEKYTTNVKKIKGYKLFKTPSNKNGVFSLEEQDVIYVYKKIEDEPKKDDEKNLPILGVNNTPFILSFILLTVLSLTNLLSYRRK